MTATVLPTSFATRRGLGETDVELLTGGMCLTARLERPEDHFEEAALELAHRRYRRLGLTAGMKST